MSLHKAFDQSGALLQWDHGSRMPTLNQTTLTDEPLRDDNVDARSYIEPGPDALVPPADFRPFFTLVEDAQTGEHHHPYIHYVFSDDDPDLVHASVLESIQEEQGAETQERFILVDVNPDGKSIGATHSLSSTWQVAQATIAQAPSWSETAPNNTTGGLMLKIEGTEIGPMTGTFDEAKTKHADALAHVENIMTGYNDKLAHLESMLKNDVLDNEHNVDVDS